MHANSDDNLSTNKCQVQLALGSGPSASDAECILRLKRWLVAGLEEIPEDASDARFQHVHLYKPRQMAAG
eukprot:137579-Alexandrium_andersonii.AAC.1